MKRKPKQNIADTGTWTRVRKGNDDSLEAMRMHEAVARILMLMPPAATGHVGGEGEEPFGLANRIDEGSPG